MPRLKLEPYHEPIGLSPEVHGVSRRWLVAALLLLIVLAAGAALVLLAR